MRFAGTEFDRGCSQTLSRIEEAKRTNDFASALAAVITVVLIGTVVAALVQGLSGFAFGLVAMAIWAWTLPPQLAGPLVVFGSIVGQLLALGSLRRSAGRGRAWPFVLGGCVGTPIGVWMLRYVDPTVFKFAVGLILIAYCPAMLLFRVMPRVTVGGRLADAGVGMVGGVMGGLGGLNGPAPTLWCGLRGWSVHEQRMVFQTFSLSMQTLTLAMYAATGLITREAVWLFVIVAPAMVIPTLIGVRLYARFSETGFRRLILVLLMLSGVVLLFASIPRLLAG